MTLEEIAGILDWLVRKDDSKPLQFEYYNDDDVGICVEDDRGCDIYAYLDQEEIVQLRDWLNKVIEENKKR